jgi:hypothetical protein
MNGREPEVKGATPPDGAPDRNESEVSLAHDEIPNRQHVDAGSVEDPHRVSRRADDWFLKSIE